MSDGCQSANCALSQAGYLLGRFPNLADLIPDLLVLDDLAPTSPDGRRKRSLVELSPHSVDDVVVERFIGLQLMVERAELRLRLGFVGQLERAELKHHSFAKLTKFKGLMHGFHYYSRLLVPDYKAIGRAFLA